VPHNDLHVLCLVHDNVSRRVAAGMEGDEWAVWTESGAPVCRINVGRGWVRAVELSGVTMVVGCGDGSVLLYDFAAHSRVTLFGFDSLADARASPQLQFLRGVLQQSQLLAGAPSARSSTHVAAPASPGTSPRGHGDDKKKGSRIAKSPSTSHSSASSAANTPAAAPAAAAAGAGAATAAAQNGGDDESSSSIGEIG
jgi:hypothetical protein